MKALLITPPFVQPNAPYPATAYLAGYLRGKGFAVEQCDLSVEVLNEVFAAGFLREVLEACAGADDPVLQRAYALREAYIGAVGPVMSFLGGRNPELATLICRPGFLPQGPAFEAMDDPQEAFGGLGVQDCAKYLSTLFLHDVSALVRATLSPGFEIARYEESIALSAAGFGELEAKLAAAPDAVERRMLALLDARIAEHGPDLVGFSVPFPGNLPAALRCAQYIGEHYPGIRTALGGGYPSTELRSMTDRGIFQYFDYVILDDGELPLERILSGGKLINTYTAEGFHAGEEHLPFASHPGPDFGGLPHGAYFSLFERTNPMHRLWSDGRWNKTMLAHGCYWARCSFCDTSLPYIARYEAAGAAQIADQMERVQAQTGSAGFHFVDEAAPPKLLRELSLELLRRGKRYTWWTNIRFEATFTGDLCRLMAQAGCVAVSGGLETASDRLLERIEKGVSIEQATMAMRNFFYAGIMVHSYLMYGLPQQTLQETVDSLEVVRQMFQAQLIDSAFWHRYAMTVHSPMGHDPQRWGVRLRTETVNPFANNEVRFVENRTYNIQAAGAALREALEHYMAGAATERPAHKWFEGKAPATTVEDGLIASHLIKPDRSRLFDPAARLVWTGAPLRRTADGIVIETPEETKEIRFGTADADFLMRLTAQAADLNGRVTLGEAKEQYAGEKPFAELYHSKKWDKLREYGLLQL